MDNVTKEYYQVCIGETYYYGSYKTIEEAQLNVYNNSNYFAKYHSGEKIAIVKVTEIKKVEEIKMFN